MIAVVWDAHRRALTVSVLAVIAVVGAVVVGVAATSRHTTAPRSSAASTAPCPARCASPTRAPPPANTAPYRGPARVTPAATPAQAQVDAQLSAAESPSLVAAGESLAVPAPAVSVAYPPVADRSDPTRYAEAFVTELLTLNPATDSRGALLAWAQSEEAPNSLPGVPAAVADKALVGSLEGLGGSASPVPSASGWPKASSGDSVRVTGLSVAVSPQWTQLTQTGWRPSDPLMVIESVTGEIAEGPGGDPKPFVLDVTLGGARHHPGYGAVSVNDWTVAA